MQNTTTFHALHLHCQRDVLQGHPKWPLVSLRVRGTMGTPKELGCRGLRPRQTQWRVPRARTRWWAPRVRTRWRALVVWGLGSGQPPRVPVGAGGACCVASTPPLWPVATALWLLPQWHSTNALPPCAVSPRCGIAPTFVAPPASPSRPPPLSPPPAGTAPTLAGLRVPPLLPLTPFRLPLPGPLRCYLVLLFLYYPLCCPPPPPLCPAP